ncbi:MAG: nucleotidyltransferase domain-containing protein [Stackebrandtia sp.]
MRETLHPQPIVANDLSEDEFLAWYGPTESMSLAEIADLFNAAGVRWWVAGGLAAEVFGEVGREHKDVDVALAAADLPKLREHLPPDLRLWEAHSGSLTPLFPGNEVYAECGQLWVRREATSPWLFEILLSAVDGDDWVFKRDHSIRMPLDEAIFRRDGVPYLAPQAVLLHKARLARDVDERDWEACLPRLDPAARAWLAAALEKHLPDHPWRARL